MINFVIPGQPVAKGRARAYGGEYKGHCPLESQEQAAFVDYLRKVYPRTYGAIVIHIKNEGKKTFGQAAYDKKNGQTKGASDIVIPGNPSFCLELKRKDRTKSKFSHEQETYLIKASENGAFACVAYGYDAAIEAFKDWQNGSNQRKD